MVIADSSVFKTSHLQRILHGGEVVWNRSVISNLILHIHNHLNLMVFSFPRIEESKVKSIRSEFIDKEGDCQTYKSNCKYQTIFMYKCMYKVSVLFVACENLYYISDVNA